MSSIILPIHRNDLIKIKQGEKKFQRISSFPKNPIDTIFFINKGYIEGYCLVDGLHHANPETLYNDYGKETGYNTKSEFLSIYGRNSYLIVLSLTKFVYLKPFKYGKQPVGYKYVEVALDISGDVHEIKSIV